jgi:Spy/CpxP family protein refolding chaperone
MQIDKFNIHCAMGSSNDWKQLGITEEQHQFLNDIGYRGSNKMGCTLEEYLNQLHKGKYTYDVSLTAMNNQEYTQTYLVIRVAV